MAPLVAVIVPIYNVAPYLNRCLDSLFNQTYKNIEIIAIDDGSSDESGQLLDERGAERPNVIIIHKENGGLSSARNAGLEIAVNSGADYIAFIDSDDYIEPDFVHVLVKLAQVHNAEIVCGSFDGFTGDKFIAPKKGFDECNAWPLSRFSALEMLFQGSIQSHIPTKLFKSELWHKMRFDESAAFMEDQKLTYRIFNMARSFVYTDYRGYNYFYGENSLVRSRFTNKKIVEALRHYFDAVQFCFGFENADDERRIHADAEALFGAAYLMLYPRFRKKDASASEKLEMASYRNYIRKHKVIARAHYIRKKDRKKRRLFMISEWLYILLYRLFIRSAGRY